MEELLKKIPISIIALCIVILTTLISIAVLKGDSSVDILGIKIEPRRLGDPNDLGLTKGGLKKELIKIGEIEEKLAKLESINKHFPIGSIIAFAGETRGIDTLPGWKLCNGASLNKEEYKELYKVIGESWGGDKGGNFNIPDLRGRFLRGVDHFATNDKEAGSRVESAPGSNRGNEVGSLQGDATRMPHKGFLTTAAGAHSHGYVTFKGTENNWVSGGGSKGGFVGFNNGQAVTAECESHSHFITGGDIETRPVNVYINWIIKVKDT